MTKPKKKSLVGWTNPIWDSTFEFKDYVEAVKIPAIWKDKLNTIMYQPVKVCITIEELND